MKKICIVLAALLLFTSVCAYSGSYSKLIRPGDTVKLLIPYGKYVDINDLKIEVNGWLALNRLGFAPLCQGTCCLYKDFYIYAEPDKTPIGKVRIFAGIPRVSIWQSFDFRGRRWLILIAQGHASYVKTSAPTRSIRSSTFYPMRSLRNYRSRSYWKNYSLRNISRYNWHSSKRYIYKPWRIRGSLYYSRYSRFRIR